MGDDIFQTVVSAGRPFPPDAKIPCGQVHLIGHNEHMLRRDLIEAGGLAHRLSGQVHIGLGLHEQHPLAADSGHRREGFEFDPVDTHAVERFRPVSGHKPGIVAGLCIFRSGISQERNDPGWFLT